jgi:hypothetical protein
MEIILVNQKFCAHLSERVCLSRKQKPSGPLVRRKFLSLLLSLAKNGSLIPDTLSGGFPDRCLSESVSFHGCNKVELLLQRGYLGKNRLGSLWGARDIYKLERRLEGPEGFRRAL